MKLEWGEICIKIMTGKKYVYHRLHHMVYVCTYMHMRAENVCLTVKNTCYVYSYIELKVYLSWSYELLSQSGYKKMSYFQVLECKYELRCQLG